MAVRIKDTTKAELCSIPVPVFTDGYIIRTHAEIMNGIEDNLTKLGYTIKETMYKSTADGKLAHGVYYLEDDEDPEIGRMITWVNCYTKQFKYRTTAGIYLKSNKAVMSFSSDKYLKKYSGLVEEIKNLTTLFDIAVDYKTGMQEINLSLAAQSHILGSLFVEHNVLTTEQASALKATMTDEQSMWDVYSNVGEVLLKSHCKDWIRNQSLVNYYFSNILEETQAKIVATLTEGLDEVGMRDPLEDNYGQPENQTNLLTQIEEFSRAQLAGVRAPEDVEIKLTVPKTNEELAAEYNATHDDSQINIEYLSPEEVKEKYGDEATKVVISALEADVNVKGFSAYDEDGNLIYSSESDPIVRPVPSAEPDPFVEDFIKEFGEPVQPDTIHYTDQAGNTFETMSFEVEGEVIEKEVLPSLEPTPEEHVLFEEEVANEMAINDDFEFDFSDDEEEEDNTDDFIL